MERKRLALALRLGAVALALATLAVAASSCGGKEGERSPAPAPSGGTQAEVADRSDVDSILQDLDRAMDSVSPEDFSETHLGDSELGL